MKVLGIVCSPRKGGNTEVLVQEALRAAAEHGAETELFSVAGRDLRPCDGCAACRRTMKCHIKDDMQALYPKLAEAQGIVMGTPVYFYSVTAQAKIVMDRTYLFLRNATNLRGKVGGVIAVAGRAGAGNANMLMEGFMVLHRMHPVGGLVAHSGGAGVAEADPEENPQADKGRVAGDERAMADAFRLGRNVVRQLQRDGVK
ncbi:MAG: flavodoxin family protein [Chloroflexi bacterium]|nr:flavodoxin family protein [Chloroflexota bacterium]